MTERQSDYTVCVWHVFGVGCIKTYSSSFEHCTSLPTTLIPVLMVMENVGPTLLCRSAARSYKLFKAFLSLKYRKRVRSSQTPRILATSSLHISGFRRTAVTTCFNTCVCRNSEKPSQQTVMTLVPWSWRSYSHWRLNMNVVCFDVLVKTEATLSFESHKTLAYAAGGHT